MAKKIDKVGISENSDGGPSFTDFTNCKMDLPIDVNPHKIRFVQPFFISDTAGGAGTKTYLTMRPNQDSKIDTTRVKNYIGALVEGLTSNIKEPQSSSSAIRDRDALQKILKPLEQAHLISLGSIPVTPGNLREALNKGLIKAFLPPSPYQPIENPHPTIALCLMFEQVWEHKGYTRGELISNMSLAPGEQLTLEFHSWDKNTFKSEQELAIESETRSSESLTERDSLTVVREMSKQRGGDINGNVSNFNIPHTPLQVSLEGNFSQSVSSSSNTTMEKTNEHTVEASNSLKITRKMRIEVSREVGREEKQTHVIANTNRCHALNFLYFEVMSNHLVKTQFVDIVPCLLLPNPTYEITPGWVLCHEDILKEALLSKIFLPGFDAARTLETDRALNDQPPASGGSEGGTVEIPGDVADSLINNIIGKFNIIAASAKAIAAAEAEFADITSQLPQPPDPDPAFDPTDILGDLPRATYIAAKVGPDLDQIIYYSLLSTNASAFNALNQLVAQKGNVSSGMLLTNFLATVKPSDLQFDTVHPPSLAKGLNMQGISSRVVNALQAWGYLDMPLNDVGLASAVQAAFDISANATQVKVMTMEKSLTTRAATAQTGSPDDGFSRMDLARAKVDFDQLKCHIEENWLHYNQAIWLRENPDQRFSRLYTQDPVAVGNIRNEVLGFVGKNAIYPIINLDILNPYIEDIQKKIEEIKKIVIATQSLVPQLITLPAQATTLEAIVSECDACEDFIKESRVIDLRVQTAKAREEESEANRYEKRVENNDYSDPNVLTAGKIVIDIGGNQTQSPG